MIQDLFNFDRGFEKQVIGTDEAGRGPASGGVFAAAVAFINPSSDLINELAKLNDSKKLSRKNREELYPIIKANTINEVICVEVAEIEKFNILNSSLKAMRQACESVINKLQGDETITLVDGNNLIRNYGFSQKYVVKGDASSASIAAASILAKVERDWYMDKLDIEFPEYNWRKNAGYLTKQHIEAIQKFGFTKYHRRSFLRNILPEEKQLSIF